MNWTSTGGRSIRLTFNLRNLRGYVVDRNLFQDQIRQMGMLITQLDQFPDGPQKSACKQLVQVLLDVHGAGLERVMEVVFESGEAGPGIIDKLSRDPSVSSLLLLYSLHPDDLETRVRKAIEHVGPRLRKLACSAEVAEINEDRVRVQVTRPDHLCGSSARDVHTMIEEGVYEFAPDVATLEVVGLEARPSAGFVALESLTGRDLAKAAPDGLLLQAGGME